MKNFVKHTLAIAICAAALLSSCIKEPEYIRSTAELSVSLTGIEDTRSETQGNIIKDAWIWAYQCTLSANGAPQIEDTATPVASRYVTGLNATNQISVHVPMPMCSEVDGTVVPQSYLLVAVINTEAFGSLDINANSNWGTVKNATFAQTGAFWGSYPKDNAPEVMPISNWTTLTITNADTHSDNCYELNLPVYRAVAKTQLYMSKAGDFDLQVLGAEVVANKEYSAGMLLTGNANTLDSNGNQLKGDNNEAIQQGMPSEEANPWWWSASPTVKTADKGYQLKNSESGFTTATIETLGSATNPESGNFTWVASTFLLENDNEAAYGVGAYDTPQGDGYNLRVTYKVGDGEPVEVYTPLGKVVRNHDYKVYATVNAGGELTFTVIVNEWSEEKEELTDFQNSVTVDNNDRLRWTNVPMGNVDGDVANTEDNIFDASTTGLIPSGRIELGPNKGNNIATCKFGLRAPTDGKWYAELVLIKGKEGVITFDNGQTVISGDISNNIVTLNICTQEANNTSNSDEDNIVELQISAKKTWGGRERTYKVYNLTGLKDGTEDKNYTIRQNIGA